MEMCGLSDSTKDLIERAHRQDKEARERLIVENMGLIGSIVKRFEGRGVDREDLFQIGSIGLIKAVDKFDTSFGVMFSTYAVPMITGEIRRFLRDDGMIKVSRTVKETSYKAFVVKEKLERTLSREPTISEIAQELDIPVCDIAAAIEANMDVESLSRVVFQGDGSDILLMDRVEDTRNGIDILADRLTVEELLEALDESERKIIHMRYYQEKTQSEVAKALSVSQVQVSRMEKRIIGKLRKKVL